MNYLLLEASYIYDAVFDTNQLSVIRGGSTLLKLAVEFVKESFPGFDCLSFGASSGLFAHDDSDLMPDDLASKIAVALNSNELLKQLNFVVVGVSAQSLATARPALLSKLSRLQLNCPTTVPDAIELLSEKSRPCGLQGIRSTVDNTLKTRIGDNEISLSDSVYRRLQYGRQQRKQFFSRELGLAEAQFGSQDIEALANCPKFTKLNNKIAILYFDGNRFGKSQADYVSQHEPDEQHEAQKRYDAFLQDHRRQLLKRIYDSLDQTQAGGELFAETRGYDGGDEANQFLRFESLLWGGDELTFVVPAWLGFDLLHLFYDECRSWQLDGSHFTHAGGIVFCNRKTPIAVVRQLAMQLVDDLVKPWNGGAGRDRDMFEYLVLESVDYPVEPSLQDHFSQRFGYIASDRAPLRPSDDWPALKSDLTMLFGPDMLSSRQLHNLAYLVCRSSREDLFGSDDASEKKTRPPWLEKTGAESQESDMSLFERAEFRLFETAGNKQMPHCINRVASELCGDPTALRQRAWFWLRLAELREYLVPEQKDD